MSHDDHQHLGPEDRDTMWYEQYPFAIWLAFQIFLVLGKVLGGWKFSWLWVTAPTWVPAVAGIVFLILMIGIMFSTERDTDKDK